MDNLNKKAYDAIKMDIVERRLSAGTRLVDSKLAEKYGISRTPIRDALMRLTEEGLVENTGKGYYVYMPSADDIRELFELRLMMDLYSARVIIEQRLLLNPDNRRRIDLSCDCPDGKISENSFVAADERFHGEMMALTGNVRLMNFYNSIRNQMRAFRNVTARSTERMNQAKSDHMLIYQAIVLGDLSAAEEAIRKHTRQSMADALRDFE